MTASTIATQPERSSNTGSTRSGHSERSEESARLASDALRPPPALTVESLTTGYGGVEIVRGVSLRVDAGEVVTILGPNGAGKSTLIKAIFGLLPVRAGRVRLGGVDLTGRPAEALVRLGVGYVPQVANVFPSLTVRENLLLGRFAHPRDGEARLAWTLDRFPLLKERFATRAGRLSGGQRQLLALGRALMAEPTLLLLDEPSAGLSPAMVDLVFDHLLALNADGVSLLLVEQNARQALSISERGYVLAAGENRLDGPAETLLASDDVRRLYLGG
jgi:ABC-type branched-subunit amino acid transport system ATPase component